MENINDLKVQIFDLLRQVERHQIEINLLSEAKNKLILQLVKLEKESPAA